jgi:DnaK suppressor protein
VAKKVTKKAKSKKAKATKAKGKSAKVSKAKKTKSKPIRAASTKRTKNTKKKSKQAKPSGKTFLTSLSTGAGAKLNGKMGSAGPTTKMVPVKRTRRKGSPLAAKKLVEFRELLMQRRHKLLSSVSQMRAESLEKNRQDAAGNLSKFPELEFTLSLLESEQDLLREIDEALERIDRGVYGICEGTGESIPRTRLKFEPWTRYTVEYANMLEKGLVRRNEVDEADETEKD